MKLFQCHCGNLLYFENRACQRCGRKVGYLPAPQMMTALEPDGDRWRALAAPDRLYRFCSNVDFDACNWLVEAGEGLWFCAACRHNGVIPSVYVAEHLRHWRIIEIAKHRLFYSLLRWNLPLKTRAEDPAHGLAFEFLADDVSAPQQQIMTGHEEGRVTIALAEADDLERERRRLAMGEPYRTLVGHFRHEIGHHYWDLLVRDGGLLEEYRALFGDDRESYADALARHYSDGPPADWPANFVSAYASVHPWEDFAETWAHYFHIVDTLETAGEFGVDINPRLDSSGEMRGELDFDPYAAENVERIIRAWLPLTFALNSINRSMGHGDVYPFVLSPPAIRKLGFVHDVIASARRRRVSEVESRIEQIAN